MAGKRKRKPRKAAPGKGARNLRDSVNTQLAKQSDQVAGKLIEKAIAGNMTGMRVLVELAGARTKPGVGDEPTGKKQKGKNWAQLLVLEQECEEAKERERQEALAAEKERAEVLSWIQNGEQPAGGEVGDGLREPGKE
jgi:hypothetical protein